MTLYENMNPTEHILFHTKCLISHLMYACKHCNTKLSFYYWTHWSCWWSQHFKKNRFNAIFHNLTQTPRSSKKADLGKKNAVGPWSHAEKRLLQLFEMNVW